MSDAANENGKVSAQEGYNKELEACKVTLKSKESYALRFVADFESASDRIV